MSSAGQGQPSAESFAAALQPLKPARGTNIVGEVGSARGDGDIQKFIEPRISLPHLPEYRRARCAELSRHVTGWSRVLFLKVDVIGGDGSDLIPERLRFPSEPRKNRL